MLVLVLDVTPSDHRYVTVPTWFTGTTSIDPVLVPAQLILNPPAVLDDRLKFIESLPGSVISMVSVAVQLFASVINRIYCPALSPEISSAVAVNPPPTSLDVSVEQLLP